MLQQHWILGGLTVLSGLNCSISAFQALSLHGFRSACVPRHDTSQFTAATQTSSKKILGLLSFDLDDTLFPIRPVVKDANEAQMNFINEKTELEHTLDEFLSATKLIRSELSKPITYTELRKRAIHSLLGSNEFVDEAFDVWLTERQASANRNLYPDATETLDTLRARYPDIPFVAITNGRGDPREIPNLQSYFDDCISGEDHNIRKPDPRIYERALQGIDLNESHWIHVGDCLANDVGASASCGALAVWLERSVDGVAEWSTATTTDVAERRQLQHAAKEKIAVKVHELSGLPAAIENLLGSQIV